MSEKSYRTATRVVHQTRDRDPYTGASTVPIYQASTYHHEGGERGGYDYARSGNPSREQVEEAVAQLEGGSHGYATSSGMAATAGALSLLKSGDHLIAPADLYGGSYRYLSQLLPQQGIEVSFVDTCDPARVEAAIRPETAALFLETPSNPLCRITDLRAMVALAQQHGLLTILDNTFMTPLLQPAIPLGIDVVVHSATKFLGGHSDLLAGIIVTDRDDLARRLRTWHNAVGAVLAPFDCFLLSRGIKTLKIRLETAQAQARELTARLQGHPRVRAVHYPGLAGHPGRAIHEGQATGAGAVFAFELADEAAAHALMRTVKLPIIAPSLGGVETILTHCWSMSHAAMPVEVKTGLGIGPQLLRISTGIEDVEDLWEDLARGLKA